VKIKAERDMKVIIQGVRHILKEGDVLEVPDDKFDSRGRKLIEHFYSIPGLRAYDIESQLLELIGDLTEDELVDKYVDEHLKRLSDAKEMIKLLFKIVWRLIHLHR